MLIIYSVFKIMLGFALFSLVLSGVFAQAWPIFASSLMGFVLLMSAIFDNTLQSEEKPQIEFAAVAYHNAKAQA
ncbi:MAG: hypothetical protein OEZ58_13180 [Gammaproteobacteria bacterium]|nr:hypothetical protein [Gammaproteobacteria bacterium]MDH5729942.1 hypothetical protein [Gammaproteobacteria bacterium]